MHTTGYAPVIRISSKEIGGNVQAQLTHARASIADAERPENSLETQTDAAVLAAIYLDESARQDPLIQDYLVRKYEAPIAHMELARYHIYALALAKRLLSTKEQI